MLLGSPHTVDVTEHPGFNVMSTWLRWSPIRECHTNSSTHSESLRVLQRTGITGTNKPVLHHPVQLVESSRELAATVVLIPEEQHYSSSDSTFTLLTVQTDAHNLEARVDMMIGRNRINVHEVQRRAAADGRQEGPRAFLRNSAQRAGAGERATAPYRSHNFRKHSNRRELPYACTLLVGQYPQPAARPRRE